jgi:hypothetical protein
MELHVTRHYSSPVSKRDAACADLRFFRTALNECDAVSEYMEDS